MDPNIAPQKIVNVQRQSFYHMLKALITLHEQINGMMLPYLEQSDYITEERKHHLKNWLSSLYRHHRLYKETVDEGFSAIDSYFDFDRDNL